MDGWRAGAVGVMYVCIYMACVRGWEFEGVYTLCIMSNLSKSEPGRLFLVCSYVCT